MLVNSLVAGVSLLAATAAAAPRHTSRQVNGGLNVVYWGQNGGGTIENNNLATYCENNAGIDVIVLAFLYSFGNNGPIPSGTIGQSCYISTSGEGQNCDNVASSIATCQQNGVKMILSIGGASSSYSLSSDSQASAIGQYIWDSYGGSGNTTVQRPFGSVSVDGFDFDIEMNNGYSQYFPSMISTLRNNFASDSSKKYVISGAPQCPIPEPNMGVIIQNSVFDYLWVQFYNNDDYAPDPCSLGYNGNAPFNYNDWISFTAGTESKNAKIFVGVPAAPLASNGAPSGEKYYITPSQLAGLVSQYGSNSRFGGIMMWSAGFSDSNVVDGCTYAQQAYSILRTGKPCGGGPISSGPTTTSTGGGGSGSTPTATATTKATPSSTATGVAGQYDQCGGNGYTGPTACQSGWVCTEISSAYSQCDPVS